MSLLGDEPMLRRSSRAVYILAGLIALSAPRSEADVVSGFDADAEGWRVVDFSDIPSGSVSGTLGVTYHATGGNPGGYISTTDPDDGDFTFGAPAAFLGDQSGATGLSYELTYQGTPDYQTVDVMLVGGGTRLLWKRSPDLTPGAGWTSVSLTFAPSSEWQVNALGGPAATAADFESVLGNLTGLFIRGEYTVGVVETAGLDNVRLVGGTAIPEPGTLLLLGLGSAGMAVQARRARRRE